MAIFYLDTSAILKRYRTEKGTDVLSELYEHLASHDALLTSHFACLEFESVAARALKRRLLNQQAYDALLGGLSDDVGEFLMILEFGGEIVNAAIAAARRYSLRAPDSIHIAAAHHADQLIKGGQFVFVASDKELLAA